MIIRLGFEKEAPTGYPFLPKASTSPLKPDPSSSSSTVETTTTEESAQSLWERFRHACATLYPNSAYAVEERVVDDWNYFLMGKQTMSDIPKRVIVGRARIKLTNPYARRISPVQLPSECSEDAKTALQALSKDCHPFVESSIQPEFLADFISNKVQNAEDVVQALPRVLRRWRWLSMGNIQDRYQTPDEKLTGEIVDLCIRHGKPDVAVHLLRFRNNYKLQPAVGDFKKLLNQLALHHHKLSGISKNLEAPSPAEKLPVEAKPFANKRSLPKHAFPFRMGPRFYFYRRLPFVLNPEPSTFAEMDLPRLPEDNDAKRLLPDDQRKKLHMIIEEQEKKFFHLERQLKEPLALRSLTNVYEVFYYMTSANPRHYRLDADADVYDSLIIAGILSRTEEGSLRSEMAAKEALENGKLSRSAFASLLAAKNEYASLCNEDQLSNRDQFGTGFLIPLFKSEVVQEGVLALKSVPAMPMDSLDPAMKQIHQLVLEKAALSLEQRLAEWKANDADGFVRLKAALLSLPQAEEFVKIGKIFE